MVWALSSKQNSIDVLQKEKRLTGVKTLKIELEKFGKIKKIGNFAEIFKLVKKIEN